MNPTACNRLNAASDAQNTDATWNEVLYVAAGGLAAAALATWLLWPKPHDTSVRAGLALTFGPARADVSLRGAF